MMLLVALVGVQVAIAFAILPLENAITIFMVLVTVAVYSIVLKKNAELKPLKAKKIDGSDLSMHFAYIRQILKDLPEKIGGKSSSSDDDSLEKTQTAVISAVSDSVRLLENTLASITAQVEEMNKSIKKIADAVNEASVISATRNSELATTVEHLGRTVAENVVLTNKVFEKTESEAEKNAARARILQETSFAMSILNRQELCCMEVQTIKQLRVCLECLFTPVELLLKSSDPSFEPRALDKARWEEISRLNEQTNKLAEAEAAGEEVDEQPEVDLTLVGVEALLVDEDGIVGCCAGTCTDECRVQASALLSEPAVQAIRAYVPGTLQAKRLEELE